MPISDRFLKQTEKDPENRVFFEIGTLEGNGIRDALNHGYDRIISVEIVKDYYEDCKNRFSEEIKSGKVTLIHGDAADHIQMVSDIKQPITFFVDAHFDDKHYDDLKKETDDVPPEESFAYEHIREFLNNNSNPDNKIIVDDIDTMLRGDNFWSKDMKYRLQGIIDLVVEFFKERNIETSFTIHSGFDKRPNDILLFEFERI